MKNKSEKGITLIALVISVIVLIILASVSIAMLTSENGIITNAYNAKIATELTSIKEKIELEELSEESKNEKLRYMTVRETNEKINDIPKEYKGKVENVEVLRSLDPSCDKEAIRVVQSLPQFIPGKQNGKAVPVYFTCPIRFQLR